MHCTHKLNASICGLLTWITFSSIPAKAQIIPDQSLPNNSQVSQQGNVIQIDGGTTSNNNLFHSFSNFSVSEGSTAFFNNAALINVIVTRVTGSNISTIDGVFKNNGGASIFFINPNGIVFGPGARLEIGGSFVATTAEGILFPDGKSFFTDDVFLNDDELSDTFPSGLFFGATPGRIEVNGNGSNLNFADPSNPVASPILGSSEGLTTGPGSTLALIGGPIIFNGGVVTSQSGSIQIGSVSGGIVGISNLSGLSFDYSLVTGFENIVLDNKSLIDASGTSDQNIHIEGNNIDIKGSSLITSSNFGEKSNSKITINATGTIDIDSLTPEDALLPQGLSGVPLGGIRGQNFASGQGPNINIVSQSLNLRNSSNIQNFNYGDSLGGDISIRSNNIFIDGTPPISGFFLPSTITTASTIGKGGNLYLTGQSLFVLNGGTITSLVFDSGIAGNINLIFNGDIYISGAFISGSQQNDFFRSLVGSVSVSPSGLGTVGSIDIKSNNLFLLDGGIIQTISTGILNSGQINIETHNRLEISGSAFGSDDIKFRSTISASKTPAENFLSQLLGLTPTVSGESGSIKINAGELIIDGGLISASNEGSATGGNIVIDADAILLNNGTISATSGTFGNGGNIDINAIALAGDRSSQIVANAQQGQGGNININTQGLLFPGTISATSEAGVQGAVRLNTQNSRVDNEIKFTTTPKQAIFPVSCSDEGDDRLTDANDNGLSLVGADQLTDDVFDNLTSTPQYPKFIDDVDGKVKPLVRVQGWYPVGNGKLQAKAILPSSALVSNQSNKLCKDFENVSSKSAHSRLQ
jgi:filamentous hemagglutinin family protein